MLNNNIILISQLSIFKKIRISKKLPYPKKFIINCNHIGEVDDLLILTILKKIIPNFSYENVKSISAVATEKEKTVFNATDSIIVNHHMNMEGINKKLEDIFTNYQDLFLILFFEGEYKKEYNKIMETKTNTILKNVNFPKTSIFNLICQKKYYDYLVDVNVIYYNNKKILTKKDNFLKFINPNTKASIQIKLYQLPTENYDEWLLDLYVKKDIELENMKNNIIFNI